MSISELSLRRPVLAIVMNILIVLFGPLVLVFLAFAIIRPSIRPTSACGRATRAPMPTSLSRRSLNHWKNQSMASPGSRIFLQFQLSNSNINIEFDLGVDLGRPPTMSGIRFRVRCAPCRRIYPRRPRLPKPMRMPTPSSV